MSHQSQICSIKKLWEQAQNLLNEANGIQDQDYLIQHEIEEHVKRITWKDLRQWLNKPQRVWVVVFPTPLPGPSRLPDYSHWATMCHAPPLLQQYCCFQCDGLGHFEWDCQQYRCRGCNQVAPGHTPKNCLGSTYDNGLQGHFDIGGHKDGNLTREC